MAEKMYNIFIFISMFLEFGDTDLEELLSDEEENESKKMSSQKFLSSLSFSSKYFVLNFNIAKLQYLIICIRNIWCHFVLFIFNHFSYNKSKII